MTDQQLIEAVLKGCGWTLTMGFSEYDGEKIKWSYWKHSDGRRMYGDQIPPILTSLDACREVLKLESLSFDDMLRFDKCLAETAATFVWLATAKDYCVAWLKCKGGGSVKDYCPDHKPTPTLNQRDQDVTVAAWMEVLGGEKTKAVASYRAEIEAALAQRISALEAALDKAEKELRIWLAERHPHHSNIENALTAIRDAKWPMQKKCLDCGAEWRDPNKHDEDCPSCHSKNIEAIPTPPPVDPR